MIASDAGFAVLGEAIADVVRSADGAERTHAGGSPMNVAYGLARLGSPVTLVTELGADEHGRLIRAHLASSGVKVATPPVQGRRTPSAVASVQEDGSAHYTFDISCGLLEVPAGAVGGHVHCGSIGAFLGPVTTSSSATSRPGEVAARRVTTRTSALSL